VFGNLYSRDNDDNYNKNNIINSFEVLGIKQEYVKPGFYELDGWAIVSVEELL
jgi:hypothetical protein